MLTMFRPRAGKNVANYNNIRKSTLVLLGQKSKSKNSIPKE